MSLFAFTPATIPPCLLASGGVTTTTLQMNIMSPSSSGGGHHIYFQALDDHPQRLNHPHSHIPTAHLSEHLLTCLGRKGITQGAWEQNHQHCLSSLASMPFIHMRTCFWALQPRKTLEAGAHCDCRFLFCFHPSAFPGKFTEGILQHLRQQAPVPEGTIRLKIHEQAGILHFTFPSNYTERIFANQIRSTLELII